MVDPFAYGQPSPLLYAIAEDGRSIMYRPNMNRLIGWPLSTLLLSQIIYWAARSDWKPFYKFKEPCSHKLYTPGDSWAEELAVSAEAVDTALGKIGTKVKRGVSKKELERQATELQAANNRQELLKFLVIYWTDSSRVSWYWLNSSLLDKSLLAVYLDHRQERCSSETAKSGLPLLIDEPQMNTTSAAAPAVKKARKPSPVQEAHALLCDSITDCLVGSKFDIPIRVYGGFVGKIAKQMRVHPFWTPDRVRSCYYNIDSYYWRNHPWGQTNHPVTLEIIEKTMDEYRKVIGGA